MSQSLLLLSNSVCHGCGYLDHAAEEIQDFLAGVETVLFVPYALHDHDGYAARARQRFTQLGFQLEPLHAAAKPRHAVGEAQAIFIGGGNTFRLLATLYDLDLLDALRTRVGSGIPYMGASAGTNVACRSIQTTNDMPIVLPPSLDALALVPFNINPHYVDPAPDSTHMGESRATRIREFHEMNETDVVGLREGAWLRVRGPTMTLGGRAGGRLFRRGAEPRELPPGTELDALLTA